MSASAKPFLLLDLKTGKPVKVTGIPDESLFGIKVGKRRAAPNEVSVLLDVPSRVNNAGEAEGVELKGLEGFQRYDSDVWADCPPPPYTDQSNAELLEHCVDAPEDMVALFQASRKVRALSAALLGTATSQNSLEETEPAAIALSTSRNLCASLVGGTDTAGTAWNLRILADRIAARAQNRLADATDEHLSRVGNIRAAAKDTRSGSAAEEYLHGRDRADRAHWFTMNFYHQSILNNLHSSSHGTPTPALKDEKACKAFLATAAKVRRAATLSQEGLLEHARVGTTEIVPGMDWAESQRAHSVSGQHTKSVEGQLDEPMQVSENDWTSMIGFEAVKETQSDGKVAYLPNIFYERLGPTQAAREEPRFSQMPWLNRHLVDGTDSVAFPECLNSQPSIMSRGDNACAAIGKYFSTLLTEVRNSRDSVNSHVQRQLSAFSGSDKDWKDLLPIGEVAAEVNLIFETMPRYTENVCGYWNKRRQGGLNEARNTIDQLLPEKGDRKTLAERWLNVASRNFDLESLQLDWKRRDKVLGTHGDWLAPTRFAKYIEERDKSKVEAGTLKDLLKSTMRKLNKSKARCGLSEIPNTVEELAAVFKPKTASTPASGSETSVGAGKDHVGSSCADSSLTTMTAESSEAAEVGVISQVETPEAETSLLEPASAPLVCTPRSISPVSSSASQLSGSQEAAEARQPEVQLMVLGDMREEAEMTVKPLENAAVFRIPRSASFCRSTAPLSSGHTCLKRRMSDSRLMDSEDEAEEDMGDLDELDADARYRPKSRTQSLDCDSSDLAHLSEVRQSSRRRWSEGQITAVADSEWPEFARSVPRDIGVLSDRDRLVGASTGGHVDWTADYERMRESVREMNAKRDGWMASQSTATNNSSAERHPPQWPSDKQTADDPRWPHGSCFFCTQVL